MVPRAILFDLDDTLCDRAAGLRRYATRLFDDYRPHGHSCTDDQFHAALTACDDYGSMRQAESLARSEIWRTRPTAGALFAHWADNFGKSAVAFDGVPELMSLLAARRILIGIVTNGASLMQQSKIDALGPRYRADVIVVSSEVGLAKPDPRIFRLALDRLGVRPADAWFVGDHPETDVRAASEAGLRAFWAKTGSHQGAPPDIGTALNSAAELASHL